MSLNAKQKRILHKISELNADKTVIYCVGFFIFGVYAGVGETSSLAWNIAFAILFLLSIWWAYKISGEIYFLKGYLEKDLDHKMDKLDELSLEGALTSSLFDILRR